MKLAAHESSHVAIYFAQSQGVEQAQPEQPKPYPKFF